MTSMQPGELMVVQDSGAALYNSRMLRVSWLLHNTVVLVLSSPRRLRQGFGNYVFVLAGGGEVGWVTEWKLALL